MKYFNRYISILVASLALMCSCYDDPIYPNGDGDLGSGTVSPTAIVEFEPAASALESRGTAGDAMKNIETLSVLMYNENKELVYLFNTYDLLNLNKDGSTSGKPDDYGESNKAESSTRRATFNLPNIEVGKYYIYAVANMGNLFKDMDEVSTPEKLRNIRLTWNTENIGSNSQMFGYFTNGTTGNSEGEAPLVTISNKTSNGTQIHSWIKRAASKVTLVYDPKGLHEGIYIYIHKVTICDIPMTCPLGADNVPNDTNLLHKKGESIYYDSFFKMHDKDEAPALTDYKKWMRIGRGTGKCGAVDSINGKRVEHSETAMALYFYENLQGNHEGDPLYWKPQIKEEVGDNVYPGDPDYKDNVSCGTYIEVEGYYISNHSPGISSGPIKYRFMLGQNTTYDYNANRNCHYKLTLGFKGYANQPDWHIEYVEENPKIFASDTYFVSYLYNQKSTFPVRLVGNCTNLECEILENNWAPYDSTTVDGIAEPGPLGDSNPFYWNKEVWENKNGTYKYGRKNHVYSDTTIFTTPPHLGFLSLTVPTAYETAERIPTNILCNPKNNTFDYRTKELQDGLENYYYGKGGYEDDVNYVPQNKRQYNMATGEHGNGRNAYTVQELPDGSKLVDVPMWTRPKTMIKISGFSGNNPFEAYQRKAVVRFRATFKLSNGDTRTLYKDVPIYQVRRIINPKGVWRDYQNNNSFNVQLMHRVGARTKSFNTFRSEGEWRAYIYKKNTTKDFISLSGGSRQENDPELGTVIYGETDTPIDFSIDFLGKTTEDESNCAMVRIEYHGFTCNHTVFVRQGYNEPLEIVPGKGAWSSFSLYAGKHTFKQTTGTAKAVMTKSPLAFGSFFKRGNLSQAILVKNNKTYGIDATVGNNALFEVKDADGKTSSVTWNNIYGANVYNSGNGVANLKAISDVNWTYTWPQLETDTYYYELPTCDQFDALTNSSVAEFGVGVLYGDGATAPALTTDDAFGFQDVDNNITWESTTGDAKKGMRGFIIYNSGTDAGYSANQVFFPIGAEGSGRRTLQGSSASGSGRSSYGTLRYSSMITTLTGPTNALRPLAFNIPNNAGAIYWTKNVVFQKDAKGTYSASIFSWDMNFTDLNFNGYDTAVGYYDNGDALPIKLIATKKK